MSRRNFCCRIQGMAEGYEDFIKAITYVAPVPVSFEDTGPAWMPE